jgi:hypothetical protein
MISTAHPYRVEDRRNFRYGDGSIPRTEMPVFRDPKTGRRKEDKMRYFLKAIGSIVFFVALAGCVSPAATPIPTTRPSASPQPERPATQPFPPTPAQPTANPGLFRLMKEVQVTPADNFLGGDFVRIAYVPGKDRMAVTFRAKLDQAEGGCSDGHGYAYAEFNRDMVPTGDYGVISCFAATDAGGLFVEDDFYLASMGHDNQTGRDGWHLTKFDAVTWKVLVSPFFHPLDGGDRIGESPVDPMVAFVNGQIDVSSVYWFSPDEELGPYTGHATHHQFFSTDLQFIGKRVLSDVPHIQMNSMIVADGVTQFVAATSFLGGNIVVMQYDKEWNSLGVKTILQNATTPEGVAYDGKRFYVAYLDNSPCATLPCRPYVHLAAFDSDWNLIEDIPVTDFAQDGRADAARPSLTYWNGRVYVCYDLTENAALTPVPGSQDPIPQVRVKMYELVNS